MKKALRTAVFLFISMVMISCSESEQTNPVVGDVSASHVAFVEETKMYLQGRDISLPDMAYTMGRVSTPTSANLQSGGLSLDWANAQYTKTGNLEILTIPIEMKEFVTVARYYKEKRKPGKTILTSLYPYLSVRKENNTGVLSSRLISYAPDVRFLRNHKLNFKIFLESQPLTKDYSGLYLVSEMDGKLKDGTLYYRGKVKYNFTPNLGNSFYSDAGKRKVEKKCISSSEKFCIMFFSENSMTKGFCNCNEDNEMDNIFPVCDACGQKPDECTCCGGCRLCQQDPCICERCTKCGMYVEECICNLCKDCDNYPCICPKCKSCNLKYKECACSDASRCQSIKCECFRCRQ